MEWLCVCCRPFKMPRVVMKPQYFVQLLWLAMPVSAYLLGRKLQSAHDEDLTRYRNKSQLFGGRKDSVW
ncbi:hypothetical protein ACOMHN_019635 [Nucella lapillus]